MKTNVTLQSTDRELFGVIVKQQTKNSFVSVTDLQLAYDKGRWQHGWGSKNHTTLMQSKDFIERCYHLLNERGLIKLQMWSFMEMVEKEGIVNVLKGLEVWKTTGRGAAKSVYCDTYIWIMLAMEMNPLMYAKVILWVTDTLIFDRIEAGTEFLPMNAEIKKICPDNKDAFMNTAVAINKRVFGYHQTRMRNLASSKQLKQITDIEKFVAQSIAAGFVTNQEQILTAIENFQLNN